MSVMVRERIGSVRERMKRWICEEREFAGRVRTVKYLFGWVHTAVGPGLGWGIGMELVTVNRTHIIV